MGLPCPAQAIRLMTSSHARDISHPDSHHRGQSFIPSSPPAEGSMTPTPTARWPDRPRRLGGFPKQTYGSDTILKSSRHLRGRSLHISTFTGVLSASPRRAGVLHATPPAP